MNERFRRGEEGPEAGARSASAATTTTDTRVTEPETRVAPAEHTTDRASVGESHWAATAPPAAPRRALRQGPVPHPPQPPPRTRAPPSPRLALLPPSTRPIARPTFARRASAATSTRRVMRGRTTTP